MVSLSNLGRADCNGICCSCSEAFKSSLQTVSCHNTRADWNAAAVSKWFLPTLLLLKVFSEVTETLKLAYEEIVLLSFLMATSASVAAANIISAISSWNLFSRPICSPSMFGLLFSCVWKWLGYECRRRHINNKEMMARICQSFTCTQWHTMGGYCSERHNGWFGVRYVGASRRIRDS